VGRRAEHKIRSAGKLAAHFTAAEPNLRLIGGQARKPEGELLRLAYIGQFLVGFTENILHYIFNFVGLTQLVQDHSMHQAIITFDQLAQSLAVACKRLPHQSSALWPS